MKNNADKVSARSSASKYPNRIRSWSTGTPEDIRHMCEGNDHLSEHAIEVCTRVRCCRLSPPAEPGRMEFSGWAMRMLWRSIPVLCTSTARKCLTGWPESVAASIEWLPSYWRSRRQASAPFLPGNAIQRHKKNTEPCGLVDRCFGFECYRQMVHKDGNCFGLPGRPAGWSSSWTRWCGSRDRTGLGWCWSDVWSCASAFRRPHLLYRTMGKNRPWHTNIPVIEPSNLVSTFDIYCTQQSIEFHVQYLK
jgi:hypothetical protein